MPRLDRPTGFQRLLAGYFQVRADEGLPVLRESVELTLEAQGAAGQQVHELLDQVVECYALVYGTVDPGALFVEVSRCRRLVTRLLAGPHTDTGQAHLRQVAGWLSALLGNVSFHTSDYAQARVHLAAAHELGVYGGSEGLVAWSRGAQSMVAWFAGEYPAAAELARDGVAHARTPLVRAQLLSWGQLRALAGMGQRTEALRVLGEAADALAADPKGSAAGRFGFDLREFELHAAEACLALEALDRAHAHASASMELRVAGTPGWGDSMLVRALADAHGRQPAQAAERATRVLDAIPPARLRETNRQRLQRLDDLLAGVDQAAVTTFREQLRALPVPPPAGQTSP